MESVQLNLGCYISYLPEWVNLDIDMDLKANVYADLNHCLPFRDGCADVVLLNHVLEHLTYERGRALIDEVHRVLRPEGALRLSVPNLAYVCKVVSDGSFHTNPLNAFALLYGSGDLSPWQVHRAGYTLELLHELLSGFSKIEEEFVWHEIRLNIRK